MAKPAGIKAEGPLPATTPNNLPLAQTTPPEGMETAVITYNGNMTFANATGGIAEYYYNQHNMLTSQRLVGFEESTLIAEFVYDGTGNRLQQVDYTGRYNYPLPADSG